jgi:hypothetical protein
VTASRAATAGGIASGWWFFGTRVFLAPFCPLTLTVWVAVELLVGVRGGITTGFECVGVGVGVGVGEVLGTGGFRSTHCIFGSFLSWNGI